MKTLRSLIVFLFITIGLVSFSTAQAGIFDDIISDSKPSIQFCDEEGECGLLEGIELAQGAINDIETERSFSEYIQDIVQYILTFVSIVAVIYIIYAGFRLMVDTGDDAEKVKRTKGIIIYVLVGIIIIWLAWPITLFFLEILGNPS